MICFAVTNFINCFIDETNESYDAYFIKSCRPAIIPVETIVTRLPPNTPYEVLPAFPNDFNIFIFRYSLIHCYNMKFSFLFQMKFRLLREKILLEGYFQQTYCPHRPLELHPLQPLCRSLHQ